MDSVIRRIRSNKSNQYFLYERWWFYNFLAVFCEETPKECYCFLLWNSLRTVKILQVTLFRFSESAILTMKSLTGAACSDLKLHTESRLGRKITGIYPASKLVQKVWCGFRNDFYISVLKSKQGRLNILNMWTICTITCTGSTDIIL